MNIKPQFPLAIFLLLSLVMTTTRLPDVWTFVHLQDASWAIFFLGGFYLRREWKWALPLLLAEAVAIDWFAVSAIGVRNVCLTAAYWFLIPAYGALWLGGAWAAKHDARNLRTLALLTLSLFVSVNLCYLISNASFYWLGGASAPTLAGWIRNFRDWYGPFLSMPFRYVGIAALAHVVAVEASAFLTAGKSRGMHD